MARLEVYRSRRGGRLLVDCQADRLSSLKTRFVIPLVPADTIAERIGALHPEFTIAGSRMVMATHLASAVLASDLGEVVDILDDPDHRIVGAIDALIGTA